jgi:transposase
MNKKNLPSKREIVPKQASTAPKQRAVFSDEFKRSAVARMKDGKQSATDLAVELDIRRNQLYKWQKQIVAQPSDEPLRSPGRPAAAEATEVEDLRRQLAAAQLELEILKKFDAYLTLLKK